MLNSKYEKFFYTGKSLKSCTYSLNKNVFNYNQKSNKILEDKVYVFGKEIDYSKNDINWHKDIFSGESFQLSFAKSINIRHNANLSAKNVWEINRLQFLPFIALNYKHTGDEKYLKQFQDIMNSWIDNNPYLIGVNWYSNIEVNIRLIVWYFCWQLLDAENIMSSNSGFRNFVDTKWIPTIYLHCKYSHANPSRFSSSNNHLISEYAGLFIATSLWNFKESKKWNKYAKAGMEHEIQRQYSKNGINKEEAAEYIQFITDFFLLSYVVGINSGNEFSKEYKNMLKAIFTYINNFLDVGGQFPQYGDEDDGKCILFDQTEHFNNFKSQLTSAALIFNDPIFKAKSNGIDTKNRVLFGNECNSIYEAVENTKIDLKTAFYDEEGHFIFRKQDGEKEIYMHLDAAPLGYLSIAAHGHADSLAFLLHVDGQAVFVDSGTYTYHTEPEWRHYFMGTLAHNTIRVNGKNQATITGPTMWSDHYKTEPIVVETNEEVDNVKAMHNGYKAFGVVHEREIVFNKRNETFTIIDRLKTQNNQTIKIDIPFHLHPQMKINSIKENYYKIDNIKGKRGVELKIDPKLPSMVCKGQEKPELIGWYSKSFMCKEPTNTIICSLEISEDTKFETNLIIV